MIIIGPYQILWGTGPWVKTLRPICAHFSRELYLAYSWVFFEYIEENVLAPLNVIIVIGKTEIWA